MRPVALIAGTALIFGACPGWADRRGELSQNLEQLTLKQALIIGFARSVALVPGTFCSGITLTAGLFSGLTRDVAARFPFLLSIPVIVAAGSLKILQLVSTGVPVEWGIIFTGTVIFAVDAMACIHDFPVFINRISVMLFVICRLRPGAVL